MLPAGVDSGQIDDPSPRPSPAPKQQAMAQDFPREGEGSIGPEGGIMGADDAVASVGGEARGDSDQAATNAGAARQHLEMPVLEGVGSTNVEHPRPPVDSRLSHSRDRTGFLSSTSHHSWPHQHPARVGHDYLYNPNFPQWSDDDWSYHPWPPETDDEVAYILDRIAEPPHEGMLERADPNLWRCNITESSSDEGHRMWENLMYFYDNAMTGRIRALNALIAAHRKIRHQDDNLKYLERNLTDFHEEIGQLRKELKGAEEEHARQQERIAGLKSENTRLKSHSLSLETKNQEVLTAMEDQIASQDRIIAKWESLGDARQAWSDADIDSPERERRFRAVEAVLKREKADAANAKAQCDRLQEKYNGLKEDLKAAIESAKRLRGENASLLKEAQDSKAMTVHWESQVQSLASQIDDKKMHARAQERKYQHEVERLTAELAGLEERLGDITAAQRTPESPRSKSTGSFASPTGRTLAEELEGLMGTLDSFGEQHGGMVHGDSEMESHLNSLRMQLLSLQQAVQGISQRVHNQLSQAQAIKATFDSGDIEDASATAAPSERRGGDLSDLSIGPHDVVIRALEEAVGLISQLRADLLSSKPTEAAQKPIGKLQAIIEQLESVAPHAAATPLIPLKQFLKESVDKGVGNEPTAAEIAVLNRHEEELRKLLQAQRDELQDYDDDKRILESIWDKLKNLKEQQGMQEKLLNEYEVHCAEHPRGPLSAIQSQELRRLANDSVGINSQIGRSNGGQGSQGVVEVLLARIQELTADEYLIARRRQLEDGLKQLNAQRTEVEAEVTRLFDLIDDIHAQTKALDGLQEKQPVEASADTEFDENYRTRLAQREERLRHGNYYNHGRVTVLADHCSRVTTFLKNEADLDRHHAQELLNEVLVNIQVASRPGRHGEAICFCSLVRVLFPRIYYSALNGACCAGGGLTTPYAPALSSTSTNTGTGTGTTHAGTTPPAGASSCHGHHGHGPLALSGRLYTFVCRVLTSFAWLVLLVLIQPYNLYTTAAFLLSALLGLHGYLYRLARHTTRRRLRGGRSVLPLPDELHPVRAARRALAAAAAAAGGPPAPSAIVGSALTLFLLFAWLSYVAVTVERRIWLGENDWRLAYLRDLEAAAMASSGGGATGREVAGYPYPAWSPLRVDYRLLAEPMWASFESAVHRWFIGGLGLGRVIGAVGALVGGFGLGVFKGMGAVKGWFSGVVRGIGNSATGLVSAAWQAVHTVAAWIGGLGEAMRHGIRAGLGWVRNGVLGVVRAGWGLVGGFWDRVLKGTGAIWGWLTRHLVSIPVRVALKAMGLLWGWVRSLGIGVFKAIEALRSWTAGFGGCVFSLVSVSFGWIRWFVEELARDLVWAAEVALVWLRYLSGRVEGAILWLIKVVLAWLRYLPGRIEGAMLWLIEGVVGLMEFLEERVDESWGYAAEGARVIGGWWLRA